MTFHEPVLVEAVGRLWLHRKQGVYVDATIGGGGYERILLPKCGPGVRVVGIDLDGEALEAAAEGLRQFGSQVVLRQGDFRQIGRLLAELAITQVEGILFDLGVSSHQLDTPARGFSYRFEGPLDMRMDTGRGTTAASIIARSSEKELAALFAHLGEERHARRIAAAIVQARAREPIRTTSQLAAVICSVVPGPLVVKTLSRCFQALRMAVNQEHEALREALDQVPGLLSPGGRVVVLSYESICDRMVKSFFVREQRGCICPPSLPTCVCGRKPTLRVLTKRPLVPSAAEKARNPRSRGAKLRAAERIAPGIEAQTESAPA